MTGGIVRGRIVLDEGDQSLEGATLHVVLEEVSRADAPAREVGRVDLAGLSRACAHANQGAMLPLQIERLSGIASEAKAVA